MRKEDVLGRQGKKSKGKSKKHSPAEIEFDIFTHEQLTKFQNWLTNTTLCEHFLCVASE